ncbi:hypothetical protein HOD75_02030 [archaeon]|jgi:hypothetical protein|nr:hypothetical protein [archaeon]MBT4241655.1 hypothetical protein [archaeon]MBT4418050.1 hypothetical protein [archaeon]
MVKEKSQIWVETAIYTLIGLTIIAILLSIAYPQIEKAKDRNVVDQMFNVLTEIDKKVSEIEQSPASIAYMDIKIGEGSLLIDSAGDTLIYTLENTNLELSEVGVDVPEGKIILRTEEHGANFKISLKLDYTSEIDMTYGGDIAGERILQAGTAPYKLKIENLASNTGTTKIDLDVS